MARDSRSGGNSASRPSQPNLPLAPRPDAATWNAVREEGLKWEGQVLLVGSGIEIPALLVLTHSRVILFSNGEAALDLPRTWLRPEPKLLNDDLVRIAITPLGGNAQSSETDRLTLKIRNGRNDAARLISAATGRVISPREERRVTRTDSPTSWSQSVGAATPMALPPLPDYDDDPVKARAERQWPPVEAAAVPEPGKAVATTESSISTWVSKNLGPEAPASPATHRNWPVQPAAPAHAEATSTSRMHRGAVWSLRSLILAILVGTAVYFGHDRLPENVSFRLPAAVEQRFGLNDDENDRDVSQVPGGTDNLGSDTATEEAAPTESTSDGTNGANNQNVVTEEDETGDNGVGGMDGELTPVDPGIGTYADDDETPATDGGQATEPGNPDEVPVQSPPTEEPAVEEPATEAPATEAPATEAPATEAPATEAPATEAPATEAPATEAPATEAPATEAPVTEEPATETPATEEPTTEPTAEPTQEPTTEPTEEPVTEEPATEAPATAEPTLESQPASVDPDVAPDQEVVSGGFRYAVTGVSRGATIAELPELAEVPTGEWIILTVDGQNWTDENQVFDMSQFRLYADGQEVLLDVGNAWIAGLLNQSPAYSNTDAIMWAPTEGHQFTLTFLAPRGAETLTLVAGDQQIDISASTAAPIAPGEGTPEPSAYIDATVVGVVDGETIVIEIDGIRQTVRYLGLDVPTGDDCFAAEATEANTALVEGQTVRIERQATDVDARGNWVRDVWAPAGDGTWVLVSESLVADGFATTGISEPNTRFAAWLLGSQAVAQQNGAGLWGSCDVDLGGGTTATTSTATTEAVMPQSTQRTFSRRGRQ